MLFSSKRLSARSLAVVALAAVPLVAPVAANAAMGGATPVVATTTPNLRSATIQNVNVTNGTQDVEYCFDKPIGSQPQNGSLRIGDYDQGEFVADSARQSSANCAVATYSTGGDIDIPQFTYGTAQGGAVINSNGVRGNNSDSTALAGSLSNAGTRGVTTTPDLTGITVNNSNSRITYTFDQKVNGQNPADFQFQNQNGDSVSGMTVVSGNGSNTIVVQFPAGTAAPAGNVGSGTNTAAAVRGTVGEAAVVAVAHPADVNPSSQSAARPGQSGNTNIPDLQSATVSGSGGSATFVFDENLLAGSTCQGLAVITSDGTRIQTTGGNVTQNTITCAIPGGTTTNEFFVSSSANPNAVTAATPAAVGSRPVLATTTSTPGSAPVGGNAGGRSAGFTTAPDAVSVSFEASTNTISVVFDQRVTNVQSGSFRLLDNTGAVSSFTANGASVVTDQSTAQRTTVNVTFPGGVSGARGLQIQAGAVTSTFSQATGNGAGGGAFGSNQFDGVNVVQALSPVGTVA